MSEYQSKLAMSKENNEQDKKEVEKAITENANPESDREFWESIKRDCGLVLPLYLQNLLNFTGFNSILSMKRFNPQEHVLELETFARTALIDYAKTVCPPEDLQDYFGLFSKCPKLFTIASGHKIMLERLSDFCKTKVAEIDKTDFTTKVKCENSKKPVENIANQDEHQSHECVKDMLTSIIFSTIMDLSDVSKDDRGTLAKPLIFLESKNGETIGLIKCALCCIGDSAAQKRSKVIVYLNSDRWNIFNYRRHCRRFHAAARDTQKDSNSQLSIVDMLTGKSATASSSLSLIALSRENSDEDVKLKRKKTENVSVASSLFG